MRALSSYSSLLTIISTQRLTRGTAVIEAGGIGLGIGTMLLVFSVVVGLTRPATVEVRDLELAVALGLSETRPPGGSSKFTSSTAKSNSPAPKSPSGATSPLAPLVVVLVPLASTGMKLSQ